MRFATVRWDGQERFVFSNGKETNTYFLWSDYAAQFPKDKSIQGGATLFDLINHSDALIPHLRKNKKTVEGLRKITIKNEDYRLPFKPILFRDFYCFEEHVKTVRKGRNAEMIPEWYEAPHFYYSNPFSFRGPNDEVPYPKDCEALDLELEIGCIVGKEVRNASVSDAADAIFGYTMVNDWTARDFQRFEMKVNMGPTKGKDFITTFGSFIITPDEIENLRSEKGYDIEFQASINGEVLTKRSWKAIHFGFEDMLIRASKKLYRLSW